MNEKLKCGGMHGCVGRIFVPTNEKCKECYLDMRMAIKEECNSLAKSAETKIDSPSVEDADT